MPRKSGGFSLAEAIIGIFLIIAAFLLVATLFHTGLQYVHKIEARNLAVMLAERRIEEMRAHAQTDLGTGYGYSDFGALLGPSRDADFPDYEVEAGVSDVTLASPSSTYQATAPRPMTNSMKKIKVTVRWSGGTLSLLSYIGDPSATARPSRHFRNVNPIVVTPTSPPIPALVPRNDTVPFSARAFDQNDRPIDDLFFQWYIKPGDANASTSQTPDGRSGSLTNVINIPSQPPLYSGGQVVVVCRAVYRGQEAFGYSPSIGLAP